jgi:hypothetical protein
MSAPRTAGVTASLIFAITVAAGGALAQPSNTFSQRSLDDLRGDWLGVTRFSDGSELRFGLEILRKADGSTGANVSIPDQGAAYIAVSTIKLEKDQLALRLDGPGLTIEGTVSEDGTTITGAGTQRGRSDPIVLRRASSLPPIGRERPQTPRPPFPYDTVEVAFQNPVDDVWLSGTLSRPTGQHGKVPAAIFVGGSGASQRDYNFDGHRLPAVIADYLTRRGFAVLRYDKRGVYKSTGNYAVATDSDFARDAAAAYDYLLRRADIDHRKIGYIGHSEGSSVSARAVVLRSGTAGFIVSMAGVGLNPIETLVLQDGAEMAAAGATVSEVSSLRDFSRKVYATALEEEDQATRTGKLRALYDGLSGDYRDTVTKWYGEYGRKTYSLNVDVASRETFVADKRQPAPTVYWQRVRAPVLVLNGGRDSQVPAADHVPAIVAALEDGRASRVDSRVFSELNHMFQTAKTGATDEYPEIDETIAPSVLQFIGDWLTEVLK